MGLKAFLRLQGAREMRGAMFVWDIVPFSFGYPTIGLVVEPHTDELS